MWRTDADLAEDLPAVMDHPHALAGPLTRLAVPVRKHRTGARGRRLGRRCGVPAGAGPPQVGPGVRALGCLLEYTAALARTGTAASTTSSTWSPTLWLRAAARLRSPPRSGVALPLLHWHAAEFTAAPRPGDERVFRDQVAELNDVA
ncbi:hypothetical protein [Streptomyces sp. 2131.1]|uniref:hypothetical protein n=1 Tax=Streptomyces sp. 2131.1 TaxID=1855346 RepID=UPI000B86601C|nr:hypothetical protein [Streptomyces sp. 2131.1]